MKCRFLLPLLCLLLPLSAHAGAARTAYDFTFRSLLEEKPMPLSAYRGKVLLVVNTASQCGFTGQYAGLEKLYKTYAPKGLVILGVPSNDFGEQEPGTNQEIASFCKLNYGVSFPMAAKEKVTGDQAHPFYTWAAETLGFGTRPKWNFHKYLIGRDGHLIDYFASTTAPDATALTLSIESALAKGE